MAHAPRLQPPQRKLVNVSFAFALKAVALLLQQESIPSMPRMLLGQPLGSSSTVGALVPYAHPTSTKVLKEATVTTFPLSPVSPPPALAPRTLARRLSGPPLQLTWRCRLPGVCAPAGLVAEQLQWDRLVRLQR